MRGTRRFPHALLIGSRFIPACAGNTSGQHAPVRRRPVHPRLCGEHEEFPVQRAVASVRFIPACAGNTPIPAFCSRPKPATVHPRLCGEHALCRRAMRGSVADRFIPACAGNTNARWWPAASMDVRFIPACAGNTSKSVDYRRPAFSSGSSPPVRGTRRRTCARRLYSPARFIPACAGNTSAAPRSRPMTRCPVHPRLCGEHRPCQAQHGRSGAAAVHPRLCGEHSRTDLWQAPEAGQRFIPACAGNTSAAPRSAANVDQPGSSPPVRGTRHDPVLHPTLGQICGSSPPVRGTLGNRARRLACQHHRFIPACAGNTTISVIL